MKYTHLLYCGHSIHNTVGKGAWKIEHHSTLCGVPICRKSNRAKKPRELRARGHKYDVTNRFAGKACFKMHILSHILIVKSRKEQAQESVLQTTTATQEILQSLTVHSLWLPSVCETCREGTKVWGRNAATIQGLQAEEWQFLNSLTLKLQTLNTLFLIMNQNIPVL